MKSNPFKSLIHWAVPGKKRIYAFPEGSREDRDLLGLKGANLCEMIRLSLPVPVGFIITTDACKEFLHHYQQEGDLYSTELHPDLAKEMEKAIHELEKETLRPFGTSLAKGGKGGGGRSFAQAEVLPLLLSVRASTPVTMISGVTDTILNLGLNEELTKVMANMSNNPRWAYDTYRRFLQMFGTLVFKIEGDRYMSIIHRYLEKRQLESENDLNEDELSQMIQEFISFTPVPHDPWEQLRMAIKAVFLSWNSNEARKSRDIHNISNDLGTAVVIQRMVYGNVNQDSGSGVVFTRNPMTGAKELYGEYLPNAEGQDLICNATPRKSIKLIEFQQFMPKFVYNTLHAYGDVLERHYKDVQEIEFTIQNGILFLLETRKAKRSARASVKIATDMVNEKLLTEREALMKLDANQMDEFLLPMVNPVMEGDSEPQKWTGESSFSCGACSGKVIFQLDGLESKEKTGEQFIYCSPQLSGKEMPFIQHIAGILTSGDCPTMLSVELRGRGKPFVSNIKGLEIDSEKQVLQTKEGDIIREGEVVTLDGTNGVVYEGYIPIQATEQDESFQTVLEWAEKYKNLHILACADSADQAEKALAFGAEGIGLCRIEQMLLKSEDRISLFREFMLSQEVETKNTFANQLIPLLQQDFFEIFQVLNGFECTIRLLDPPLQAFFPDPSNASFHDEVSQLSGRLEMRCESKVMLIQDINSALGCRGTRLLLLFPELLDLQIKSIVGAAIEAKKKNIVCPLKLLLPFIFSDHEIDMITPKIIKIAHDLCEEAGVLLLDLGLDIGATIELPRACIRADKIATARNISFITIGSNMLTELTFGLAREDSQKIMPAYLQKHIVGHDPFRSLDFHAVGPLIHLAVKRSRDIKPSIKISLCGDHAADLHSIYFLERNNVNDVICDPFRIPSAKIAAAQSRIEFVAREHAKELEISRRMIGTEMFLF